MKRVMITGARGFLGKRLVKRLSETKEFDLDILTQDITDLNLHIEPSDVIIHLAAKHPSNKGDILKVTMRQLNVWALYAQVILILYFYQLIMFSKKKIQNNILKILKKNQKQIMEYLSR